MEIEGEEENFVLLSKIRTGLKREFQFALKSQNEVAGLLTRTRIRKSPITELNEFSAMKKMRKSNQVFMSPHQLVESEDEQKSDIVDLTIDEESNRQHTVESQRKENDNVGGNEDDPIVVEDDVKKVPTRLKELLETGFLEGVSVRYIRGCKVQYQNNK